MKTLGFLVAFTLAAFAQDLEKSLDELQAQHRKLEGYLATYKSVSEKGKQALIETGIDHKSGWAFVQISFKDAEGTATGNIEMWVTEDGDYIVKEDENIARFEGFGKLAARLEELRLIISKDGEVSPSSIAIVVLLEEKNIDCGISFSTRAPRWLTGPEKLLQANDDEVTVSWENYGKITIDRTSGLIKLQELELEGGKRTLKLVDWKKNPGAKAVSERMNIPLEAAIRKNIGDSGLSQKLIRGVFQQLLEETAKLDEGGKDYEEFLAKLEDKFVTYLEGESLGRVPFFKQELSFIAIDHFVEKVQALAVDKGQEIEAAAIFGDARFRNKFENDFASGLIKRAPEKMKPFFLNDLLGGELKVNGRKQIEARKQTEKFLEKAYYRARIRSDIKDYFKK